MAVALGGVVRAVPKRWPGCEGAALALVTPSVRLRSEGRRRRCLPGLFPAPSRRRAPRALPPGPPFRAGASRPPRQAQRGPRVRHGENGSGALPPRQQPPSPLLLALDPGSRRLRRSPRRPAASAPALRWSKGPGVRREACPAWTPPGPLLCAPAPPGGASAAGHAARAQAARRAAGLDRAPIASGAPSRGRLGRTRSLISLSLFGLQVSGTEEGRLGPMCGRIASASQTCTDFGCCFGQWFCSDFFRIVANSPLFPGCLQTWIRNFFSTGSHWCRSVCNEPGECYCSLHFREPPSAQLRPRRPQGVYRD